MENANIDETRKHPIVLPSSHKITLIIFECRHRELLHAGPQLLLSEVRRQYWPLLGRVNARSVVRRCVKCTRACPRFDQPLMAALPKDRVQCARLFTVTGIDFAGPIYVRSGLRRVPAKKAFIAIFICFSTKAITWNSQRIFLVHPSWPFYVVLWPGEASAQKSTLTMAQIL